MSNPNERVGESIETAGSGTMRRAEFRGETADAADLLARAQTSLRRVVDLSAEMVIIHRSGCALHANPAALRALGVHRVEEVLGTPIETFLHSDDLATALPRLLCRRAEPTGDTLTVRWRRKEGGYRMTEATATSIDFEGSEAILVAARDISERIEFQQQLWHRDRMAALGTLSAGVAHEINNPLTYLLANLEHVLRRLRAAGASDDPTAELTETDGHGSLPALIQSLQHAVDGADRVRQIVRNLLTFSQGNVDQRGIADLRGTLESAIQMAWHVIRHRARLVKSFGEVPPVKANEATLGQVFLNLLVNAAQAIPEGCAENHEIRVVTRTDKHKNAVVEVSDTGSGIAPEHLPRIFDPFFTTKGGGAQGLGLATSHGTVSALGGEIHVESTPGRGTTFRVILPAGRIRDVSLRSSGVPGASAVPRNRVLVIDDEKLVAEAIARVLSEGDDVEIVTEARDALSRIASGQSYDVILCDLMMPVMTGMDLYAELVRTAPELASRIVFMSGGTFTRGARAFIENMSNRCLEKPLDMGKLRRLLVRMSRS